MNTYITLHNNLDLLFTNYEYIIKYIEFVNILYSYHAEFDTGTDAIETAFNMLSK